MISKIKEARANDENSGHVNLNSYNPSLFLDRLVFHLNLKNDSALARLLETRPQYVSKVRRRIIPVSAALLIRFSEISSFDVTQLRILLGDRRKKHRIGPNHFKPKQEVRITSLATQMKTVKASMRAL